MEFLAESIGLLDIDGVGVAAQAAAKSSSNATETAAAASSSSSSFFFFPSWGGLEESSEQNPRGDDAGDFAVVTDEQENPDIECTTATTPTKEGGGDTELELEQEEEEELGSSSLSLLSSLTPASPMTLSASSLNLIPASTERKRYRKNNSFEIHTGNDENSNIHHRVEFAPAATTPSMVHLPDSHDMLTKRITQRIDARTNYDCFTGDVDAVTGHLIHGTRVYRQTGEVYEGSFITRYKDSTDLIGENTSSCDTMYLRHGTNATCHYSNGMEFSGTFEYDRPKFGKWACGDEWTYKGPLIPAFEEEKKNDEVIRINENKDHYNQHQLRNSINAGNAKYGTFGELSNSSIGSDMSNNSSSIAASHHSLKQVIGIPHPLPGSVLFHGDNGVFGRPSDGFCYKGDFVHGLANGVGKEILPHGQGVYTGEFEDGLRHGVGTLVENYYEDDEGDKVYCLCGEDGVESESAYDGNDLISRFDDAEDSAAADENDGSTSSIENVEDSDQDIDRGPDFAAGGPPTVAQNNAAEELVPLPPPFDHCDNETDTTSPNTPIHCSTNTTEDHSYTADLVQQPQQHAAAQTPRIKQRAKIQKQRYSSGVWCAGQYEIEDCRGTVDPDSNEFMEDDCTAAAHATSIDSPAANRASSDEHATTDLAENVLTNENARTPLRRTTWDMLDEKWLGI